MSAVQVALQQNVSLVRITCALHERENRTCICQSCRLSECSKSTSVISFTFMASFKSCLFAIMRIAASCRCSCSKSVNSSACRREQEAPQTAF